MSREIPLLFEPFEVKASMRSTFKSTYRAAWTLKNSRAVTTREQV